MNKEKKRFWIDCKRPTAIASMIALALSIPLLVMGYADRLKEPLVAIMLVLLPALSALLMIIVILKFGRNALWLSTIPVFLGVLGFFCKLIVDSLGTTLLHHIAAAALYIAVVILWALTVFYIIKTKWVLVILFLIPFVKHICMNDLPILLGSAPPVSLSIWLKEFSMLLLMLGLSLCAASFEDPNKL